MSDRGTEQRGPAMLLGNGEQGELRIEVDEFLDNHLFDITTRALHSFLEGLLQLTIIVDIALTMTRR